MEAVYVWVAHLDGPPAVLASLAAELTPAERARAARYRQDRDGARFMAARGWLRRVLAAELGVAAAEVAFTDGPGKPRLADDGPCFNLSHSEALALIAVAGDEVGVDVEHVSRGPSVLEATAVACSPREATALSRLRPPDRVGQFLRWWTAKEAYLKATGAGLSVPPDLIEVGAEEADGLAPVLAGGRPVPWCVRQLQPAPGYMGAVAAEGRGWDVLLRSVDALGVG